MDLLFFIIVPVIVSILAGVLQSYLLTQSNKEFEQYDNEHKTTYSKKLFLFFLISFIICNVLFVLGGILIYVSEIFSDTAAWISFISAGILFELISGIGLINTITTYEIIESDRIIVCRWFKKRDVYYKDIKNYEYSSNQLIIFDINDRPILEVLDNRVGVNNIINMLDIKGKLRK